MGAATSNKWYDNDYDDDLMSNKHWLVTSRPSNRQDLAGKEANDNSDDNFM